MVTNCQEGVYDYLLTYLLIAPRSCVAVPMLCLQLDGGVFNAINSTSITAFDENGVTLLQVTNSEIESIECLGLATNDGSALIKGVLFSLVGAEPAGFAIDNVRFTFGCCEEAS